MFIPFFLFFASKVHRYKRSDFVEILQFLRNIERSFALFVSALEIRSFGVKTLVIRIRVVGELFLENTCISKMLETYTVRLVDREQTEWIGFGACHLNCYSNLREAYYYAYLLRSRQINGGGE